MARGGATVTGFDELRRAIERLPDDVRGILKRTARATAERIRIRAQENLRAQTHGTGATAAAIVVIDESAEGRFVVQARAPEGKPANLPLWLEYGTDKMAARPFMRPAADAEDERYKHDALAAVTAVVDRLGDR